MTYSLSDLIALISLLISLASLAKVFLSVAQNMAKLEVKVDTMWDFTIRRGNIEAVVHGYAKRNSPITFTPEAALIIAPLIPDLRAMYEMLGDPPDTTLAFEIEQRFGERLLKEVCIPHGIYMGACLVLAIEAAKGKITSPSEVGQCH